MVTRLIQTTALLALLCGLASADGKSVFWEPYEYDGDTAVLCHFDGKQPVSVVELMALPDEEATGGLAGGSAAAVPGDGPRTANAVPMAGAAVPLLGACEERAGEGRFGGGLRLSGKDGRMTVSAAPQRGWAVECWLKAARLPKERATLLDLPRGQPVRVSLLADGRLAVDGMGRKGPELSEWRCVPQTWFHLALVWQPATFHVDNVTSAEMLVYVNGRVVVRSGAEPAKTIAYAVSGPVTIGNDARGGSGFDGWLDELRVSSGAREFYDLDLDWVDAEGKRPAPAGRPYFRDEADLLLWLPFDDTLAPARAAEGIALAAGTPLSAAALKDEAKGWGFRFGEGVGKRGLLLTAGEKGVRYEGVPALARRGTIAFWFRPRDWDNAKQWNPFAKFPQEFAPVFRMEQEGKRLMAFTWIKTPNTDFYPNPVDLNPGRWVHLALTWSNGALSRVYLNGQPWAHGGAADWHYDPKKWDETKPLTLVFPACKDAVYVDDFRVYRRPLAPTEIGNLASLYDRRAEIKALPDFDCSADLNGALGRARVTVYPLMEDYGRVAAATLTLTGPASNKALGEARAEAEPDSPIALSVQTGPIGFGEFTLTVRALDAQGALIKEQVVTSVRKQPPWWQSRAGLSDKVMPDWTPVAVKDRTLSVVGREIRFSDAGLPEALSSAGGDVLARPVEWVAGADGRTAPLAPVPGAFKAEAKDETRADFSGRAAGAGIVAEVKGYLEFDGFMWFSVALKSAGDAPAKLEALKLRIPYAADASGFLHAWNGNSWFRAPTNVRIMETPRAPGTVFSSLDKKLIRTADNLRGSFLPFVTLAGDRRGMTWFAENDRGWTQSATTPAVLVERLEDGSVVLTLNIISEVVSLAEPRVFEFGLHPVPVKAKDAAWRSWAFWTVAPDHFYGNNLKSEQHGLHTGMQRVPDHLDWEAVRRRYETGMQRFADPKRWPPGDQPRTVQVPGLYLNLRGMGGLPREDAEWSGDWYGYGWGKGWDTLRYTREMIDFSAYYLNEWVRRGFCRGVYLDDAWNSAQRVVPGPAAYLLEDGHVQPGFEWRGQREYLRRMRQIFYDNGLTPHMCIHLTHTHYPMFMSFFDVIYDGEDHDLRPAGSPQDFMDLWTPFRIRFHNGEKWGLATFWHGWVGNNMKQNIGKMPTWRFRQGRAYAGALLVHDVGWLNRETFAYEFGAAWNDWVRPNILSRPENRFVGYWDPQTPAAHDHPNLYVSVWKRDGWCAVALANYGKDRLEAEVRLDLARMGLDGLTSDAVAVTDVDRTLLQYFDDDVTQLAAPKVQETATLTGEEKLVEEGMEELALAEKPTLDERKAKDPDGKFSWKDGVLRCPVRRHDFRLFEFRRARNP